ncbi:WxL domain-containing protein [Aerococcus viridans]
MQSRKKFIALLAVTLFGVTTFVPSVEAAKSNANVEFEAPDEAPAILNPDYPDEAPTDEQEEERDDNVTGDYGVLTLDFISDLNFGKQKLSPKAETYFLENATTPFAQVTDVRDTGKGWRLVAELDSFKDTSNLSSLPGATITLNNTSHVTQSENKSAAPTSAPEEIILSADNTSTPITTASDTTAGEPQGLGTWITRWIDIDENPNSNESVALNVPAAVATEDKHTADITWTLYNTPTGTDVEAVNVVTEP